MSKWKWKRPDIIEMPDGRRYFFMASGHDFEAHINALQAVAEAAKSVMDKSWLDAEIFAELRTALAGLEAGND
jgi:hypothetical protein